MNVSCCVQWNKYKNSKYKFHFAVGLQTVNKSGDKEEEDDDDSEYSDEEEDDSEYSYADARQLAVAYAAIGIGRWLKESYLPVHCNGHLCSKPAQQLFHSVFEAYWPEIDLDLLYDDVRSNVGGNSSETKFTATCAAIRNVSENENYYKARFWIIC